jgi:RNA polymerase-binding transcription factor DksA
MVFSTDRHEVVGGSASVTFEGSGPAEGLQDVGRQWTRAAEPAARTTGTRVRGELTKRRRGAGQLLALREELQRQRDFRTEQLAHLDTHDDQGPALMGYGPRAADPDAADALDEVRALVAAGARQALADIELALARMDDGRFGRCRTCDAAIPLAVLTAIPKTTLCLACSLLPVR